MARRRIRGEGCLIHNKNGSVSIRIDIGRTIDGKRKTKTFTGKTHTEARKKLEEYKKKQKYLSLKIVCQ